MKNCIYTILLFFVFVAQLAAQGARITGKVTDKSNNETLIGATVILKGKTIGASTDFDGNYAIENIPAGKYDLSCSYVGYREMSFSIEIKNGQTLNFDFPLELDSKVLEGIVVVGKVDRNMVTALTQLQQKSPGMLTGITNEDIKKSPDRNTSDVLKRVSGTSVQDNKFVVIRGLADRYNVALINGMALPSTEPDRRAFSFDLFPSSLLSNLLIYKTATPDLPGEFAGGVIVVNTKEVPEEKFVSFSAGMGYNTQSTFKPYNFYQTGGKDWLGYDDGTRSLPASVTKAALNGANKYDIAKQVPNDWGMKSYASMAPTQNYQLAAGTHLSVLGRDLGIVTALTYSNVQRYYQFDRADFNIDKTQLYQYTDNQYRKDVSLGGMLNTTYRLSKNHKISWNNVFSQHGDDQFIQRIGKDIEQERFNNGYSMFYNSTRLFTSQLLGEHALTEGGVKVKWGAAYNKIDRSTPSYRRMTYVKNYDSEVTEPFQAYIPQGAPSPNYAGRFYSDQQEQSWNFNADLNLPYQLFGQQNMVKVGGFADLKDRNFGARVLGYSRAVRYDASKGLEYLPIDQLLDPQNINEKGFVLKESTNPNDSYDANSTLYGGYAMVEQYFSPKLRVIAGLRMENFGQQLNTFTYGGQPVNVNRTTTDFLPSLNLIFAANNRTNVRFSASQTVCRPNFRELAPFSFYDFNLSAAVVGNPDLVRTKITNLDLKYEFFPTPGESFAITAFYKDFQNPIEQFYESTGAGTRNFVFANAKKASNYGAELEFRYKLGNVSSVLDNFLFFTNLSYIYSKVDVSVSAVTAVNGSERALQGQSPYIANGGLNYSLPRAGFGATLLYNRIGRRIWLVGSNQYLDTYEAPRNVLDFQITQRIFKNGEIKINVQDILNNEAIYYQDQNKSGKFDAGDTRIIGTRFGTNYSVTLSYRF